MQHNVPSIGSKRQKGAISDYSKQQHPHFFLLLNIYMDDLFYKYCLGVNIYKETTYQ